MYSVGTTHYSHSVNRNLLQGPRLRGDDEVKLREMTRIARGRMTMLGFEDSRSGQERNNEARIKY